MSLGRNIIANYLGQAWTVLIGLVFIPVYIRYIGIESFGLIGVFALLQTLFTLLDIGMTPTLNREMARYTAGAHTSQSIRDLLRSLEIIGLAMSAVIGLLVWVMADWLARKWLRVWTLPVETVSQVIVLMGVVLALRFMEGLYRSAILGLQRQVFYNAYNSLFATLRAVGAVAVLAWLSPTIEAYFAWQGAVSIMSLATLAAAVYRRLPKVSRLPRFSCQAILGIWRFAGGVLTTTFFALLLTQVDKILLSRLLSLDAFGYYTLASTVASVIGHLVIPVAQAFYPRLSEIVARGDAQELARAYHRGAQLVTTLAAPAALMLIFFSERILRLWTGDAALAQQVAPLLALLSAGALLNGLMVIPYMLTLAHGWSGFAVRINAVAVVVLVPAIVWATLNHGALGAAWVWVLLNVGYVLLGIRYLHRRLLPREMWAWYRQDVALPLAGAAVVAALGSALSGEDGTWIATLSILLAAGAGSYAMAALLVPALRRSMLDWIAGVRYKRNR